MYRNVSQERGRELSWQEPESLTHSFYSVTGDGRARIRAADADREFVAAVLGTAYGDGRLSEDEYQTRLAEAFSARSYAQLDLLISDLPVVSAAPGSQAAAPARPVPEVNRLAVASLACGLGQFLIGPLAIVAIVLGLTARRQIRRTGQRGAGLALAGLILGWFAVIAAITLMLALAIGTQGGVPTQ